MPDQSVADAISLSDAQQLNLSRPVSSSDTLSLSDVIFLAVPTRTIVYDTLFLSDNIQISTHGLELTFGDSLSLADSVRASRTGNISLSDSIAISDVGLVTLNLALGVSDTILISDGVVASPNSIFLNVTHTAIESLVFFDSIMCVASNSFVFSNYGDSLLLSDEINVILNSTRDSYLRRYLNDMQ
jgi:hypothetical protein